MRSPGINFDNGALDDFGRQKRRGANRHDLVIITVQDQRRHIELLEVFGGVFFRERFDEVETTLVAGKNSLQPEKTPESLGQVGPWPIGSIERRAKIFEKLG